jgi:hypothetical protein
MWSGIHGVVVLAMTGYNLGVADLLEKIGSLGNVRHRIRNDEYH